MSANYSELKERYDIGDVLGSTPAGKLFEGFDKKFGRKVAIRLLDNVYDEKVLKRFERFIKNAGQMVHPNIVSVQDFGIEDDYAYSIHENIEGGFHTLDLDRIKMLEHEDKRKIIDQLINAMSFSHSIDILHRNLSLDAVYITDIDKIKLDLFDLRRYIIKESLVSELGLESKTPIFLSPEELEGEPSDETSDIFQFGCLLYTIITGSECFGGKTVEKTIKNIKAGEYVNPTYFSDLSTEYMPIIKGCLEVNRSSRIQSFEELLEKIKGEKEAGKSSFTRSTLPYKFDIIEGRAYMTVSPGYADKIEIKDIESKFIDENIYNYNLERIKECIKIADGRKREIGPAFKKLDVYNVHEIEIIINADSLKAYVKIPDSVSVREEELIFYLKKNGVKYGIQKDNIARVLKEPLHTNIPVAIGLESVRGEDAYLIYFFEKENVMKPKIENEEDSADFKEIHTIQEIFKGDVLCMKIPPTEGVDGISVLGGAIKAKPGRDINMPVGKNTAVSHDGLKLLATIDGQISMKGRKVNVLELIVINGNVDYSVGNVRYKGDVIVRGDVLPDFSITAGGDILIYGVVEGANLESERGSITVRHGIFGKEKGRVIALKDVKADFLQDVMVEAGRDVLIPNYVRNSNVKAGRTFDCSKGIGNVLGSTVEASKLIEINTGGTKPYVRTRLVINKKPKEYLKRVMNDIKDKVAKTNEALNIIKRQLKRVILKYGSVEDASEDREYRIAFDKLKHLEDYLKKLNERFEMTLSDYEDRTDNFIEYVLVKKFMYADVMIKIGNHTFITKEEYEGRSMVTSDDQSIKLNGA